MFDNTQCVLISNKRTWAYFIYSWCLEMLTWWNCSERLNLKHLTTICKYTKMKQLFKGMKVASIQLQLNKAILWCVFEIFISLLCNFLSRIGHTLKAKSATIVGTQRHTHRSNLLCTHTHTHTHTHTTHTLVSERVLDHHKVCYQVLKPN